MDQERAEVELTIQIGAEESGDVLSILTREARKVAAKTRGGRDRRRGTMVLRGDAPGYHGSAPGEAVPAMGEEESESGGAHLCDRGPAEPMFCDCMGMCACHATAQHDMGTAPPAIAPPDPAALTEWVVRAFVALDDAAALLKGATTERDAAIGSLGLACDAKARSLGAGKFCTIAGIVGRCGGWRGWRWGSEQSDRSGHPRKR